jgi:putative flippase GtrA
MLSLQIMIRQVGLFGLVGIANTLIDFAIYNLFTLKAIGCNRIAANLISTSVAMTFSFAMNLKFVFPVLGGDILMLSAKFLGTTAFSLYIVQNAVIFIATRLRTMYACRLKTLLQYLPPNRRPAEDFVERNGVKLLAVLASLTCNFLAYKYIVFIA